MRFYFSVKQIESSQASLAEELVSCKSRHRRQEREWLAEKETLHRKVQFLQQFGGGGAAAKDDATAGGFFTDQRAAGRLAAEGKLKKQVQRLNVSLKICPVTYPIFNSFTLSVRACRAKEGRGFVSIPGVDHGGRGG